MQFLRQGTAEVIQFGPFVDKDDGVTLKTDGTTITDIDHATTGIFVSKNGAAAAIRSQAIAAASVADAYGMMRVTLSTTDTNTLGTLDVDFAKAATYLPVNKEFMVIPATLYDTLFVVQPAAAINKFFDVATPTGTVDSIPDAVAGEAGGLAIVGSEMVVPDNQKVDLNTVKTQVVTCAAAVTFNPSIGAATIVPTNTQMVAAFTEIKGATFSATDTLEAIRNRGDAEWITATGFAEAGDAMSLIDNAITNAKYDESTAFPLTAVNGSTLTEAGGDGDHLTALPTIARVTLVDTVTDNSDLVTAAAIKTAMEASGSDLDNLTIALVNKLVITEVSGNTMMYADNGDEIGSITEAFDSVAGVTTKKRMVYVP